MTNTLTEKIKQELLITRLIYIYILLSFRAALKFSSQGSSVIIKDVGVGRSGL